ncbi:MAG: glutamate formimidoyltransferase [Firmicutes bacterium]|nr:glutamate formimidoyltransferase [Bacillota bacterium]
MRVLMCVPNISEGRNREMVEAVVDQVRTTAGAKLLDYSSDEDHNRSVITYLGAPEAVLEATKKLADKTFEIIDMTKHSGAHPRMGALDVVPFIPIRDVETAEAVEISRVFGKFVGAKGIPVYYYEDAATRPERQSLVNVRKGQYEGLRDKLCDPNWKPDEGPAEFNARTGAVITGARFPLVAFNVNLRTDDLSIAERIARAVRHINGGYRYVRAMGLSLEDKGMVQVSMNLIDYRKTPIPRVMETIRSEAARYGVLVAGAELVGPVPLMALDEVVKHYLQVHDFNMGQIIENTLID